MQAHSNGPVLDDALLEDPALQEAISSGGEFETNVDIVNVDRCSFARVAGAVARQHGDFSFPGKLTFNVKVSLCLCICPNSPHCNRHWSAACST